jgi:calcineurin-like phosphoesterase family protein
MASSIRLVLNIQGRIVASEEIAPVILLPGYVLMMISPQLSFPFDDQTWIISDTHFFHANIGRYCDRPEGWQNKIIENWNHFIQSDEVVFHLGDLALGRKDHLISLIPQLNGQLFLMRGNHDRRSKSFYQELNISLVPDPYLMIHPSGIRLMFSHRPILTLEPNLLNLHGHIHNNPAPELGPRHINMSVEVAGYRPWRLGDVLTPYLK